MFLVRAIASFFNLFTTPTPEPPPTTGKRSIPPRIREAVWNHYHQNRDSGVCYACGTYIYRYNRGWHCSHVQAESKGGSLNLDNLRTCCQHCNLSMGDQNLYAYIQMYQLQGPGSRNVNSYFRRYPDQRHDVRTNNWKRKSQNSNPGFFDQLFS